MLNNQDFAQKREESLGGSDIGAILGLSKFRTAVDVWLEKTGQAAPSASSLPLRFGSFAEEFVASEYGKATGYRVSIHETTLTHPQYAYCTGHLDRLVSIGGQACLNEVGDIQTPRLLECKTANPFSISEWGDVGTDQVPMSYLVQCQWYLMLSGCQWADLAVLIGNSDFRIYSITHDPELSELLLQRAIHFWTEHVQKRIPPPAANETDLRALFPKNQMGLAKEASPELIEEIETLHRLNQTISTHESECSAIKQHIMAHLEEAENLTYQGKTIATWKTPKPSYRIDSQRLNKEYPELMAQYQTPISNSRRLVIKELS
jgi:putative phage-type endonuclease